MTVRSYPMCSRRKSRRYVLLDPGIYFGLFTDMPERPSPSEGSLFADLPASSASTPVQSADTNARGRPRSSGVEGQEGEAMNVANARALEPHIAIAAGELSI
jgi:hypothetical protein